MEKVSCIVTTKNRLSLLKRAIKSIQEQNYPDKELIIVDDGSNDGTQEWCEQLAQIIRIDYKYINIPRGESRGGNYARNLGIKVSSGEYIAFLDDDDQWLPDKLSCQINEMQKDPNYVLVYGNRIIEYIGKQGEISSKQFPLNPYYRGDVSKKILTSIFTTTSLILVKTDALHNVGLFDENLCFWQEYELSIRLAQIGLFSYVDKPLIRYRVDMFDRNRLTNRYYEWKEAVRYVYQKHKNLYCQLSLLERFKAKLLYWGDASQRSKTCGFIIHSKYYYSLCFLFKIIISIIDGSFFSKIQKKL